METQRLIALDASFEKLEKKADVFHTMQASQVERQEQLYSQTEVKIQLTNDKLAVIDGLASNIAFGFGEISPALTMIANIGSVLGRTMQWSVYGSYLGTLLLISWFSRRTALYVTAFTGMHTPTSFLCLVLLTLRSCNLGFPYLATRHHP